MAWVYKQSNGRLWHEEDVPQVFTGYSGHERGLNNPELGAVPNVGPLPAGWYRIGEVEPTHGALGVLVMALHRLTGTGSGRWDPHTARWVCW